MAPAHMRTLNRLSHLKAARLKIPGIYEDGGGLRLVVSDSLTKRWVMRVTINGKRRERGLGSFPTISLEDARERAAALRKAARQGRDLARDERRLRASAGITFVVPLSKRCLEILAEAKTVISSPDLVFPNACFWMEFGRSQRDEGRLIGKLIDRE